MKKRDSCYYEKEIFRLSGAMHRRFADRISSILPDDRFTVSHLIILEFLDANESSNMSELSKNLKLTMSAMTSIIDRMIELELVERHHSKDDRRIVLVTLTKGGNALLLKINKNRLAIIKEIFSVLTDKEKESYLGLIKKIYTGLKDKR